MRSFASAFAFSVFFCLISSSIAQTISFRPKALVLPVTKDSKTGQYITQISQRTPLVPVKLTVDLGGQFLWVDCKKGYVSSSYKPAICGSAQCSLANSKSCGDCNNGPKINCNNNTCRQYPCNSIIQVCTIGEITEDVLSLQSTDGSNPGPIVVAPKILFPCGDTKSLLGLAKGVKGMAGLGRGEAGLPSQLASSFRFSRRFAVCLGSTGVIFFGDSPSYNFLPGRDISKSLSYTPLLINPVNINPIYFKGEPSAEYYVRVTSIRVNEKPVSINSTLLSINDDGNGGTKISTVVPYTVMETSIYNALTNAFSQAFSGVPRVKPGAPFGLCFNSSNVGSTRVGPAAPIIDFVFQSPTVMWRIFGSNSLVRVKEDVLCFGFVDGGDIRRTSIEIGTHQIENNLLEFDIARSRLGFSSTLLFQQTTCSNFNFTSNA